MICRRCGNRVPEYLTTREFFQCPACGRSFGTPPAERVQERPRVPREDERRTRYDREASYNNGSRRESSRFGYVDEDYYEERQPVYEEPEQDFVEEPEIFDDLTDVEAMPKTMKLTTLIGFEALALIALAVVWLVSLGL